MTQNIVRRFYVDEFDPEKHESTAELNTLDICTDCFKEHNYSEDQFPEEEKLIPPQLDCELCSYTDPR